MLVCAFVVVVAKMKKHVALGMHARPPPRPPLNVITMAEAAAESVKTASHSRRAFLRQLDDVNQVKIVK